MKKYGIVKSTERPESLVIDDFNVWQHTKITAISENVGKENEFVGFQFDMVQFGKDEFIKNQAEQNESLEIQLTDTQLALTEIYESIGGVK
ncbi:MAG: hypothetical protein RR263_04400 [Oscillospiraceae bacterium]